MFDGASSRQLHQVAIRLALAVDQKTCDKAQMRAFFAAIIFISVVAIFYEFVLEIDVMAHNQYLNRQYLLTATEPESVQRHSKVLGLTKSELSNCDNYIAEAYKESVFDGYRLGTGWGSLDELCLGLSAVLFVTGIVGYRFVQKTRVKQSASSTS